MAENGNGNTEQEQEMEEEVPEKEKRSRGAEEQWSRWHKLRAYRMQIVMNYCVLL